MIFEERLRMENFEVLKDDSFCMIKKDIKSAENRDLEIDDDSNYDSSSSNIFADLEGEEFRILAQKCSKAKN